MMTSVYYDYAFCKTDSSIGIYAMSTYRARCVSGHGRPDTVLRTWQDVCCTVKVVVFYLVI